MTSSSKRHLNYIHHHDISPKAQSFHGPSTCFVVYCPGLSLALFHCNLRRKTRILIYFCHKNEPHLYVHTHTFDKGSPRNKVCRRVKRASFDVGSIVIMFQIRTDDMVYQCPRVNGWMRSTLKLETRSSPSAEEPDNLQDQIWVSLWTK